MFLHLGGLPLPAYVAYLPAYPSRLRELSTHPSDCVVLQTVKQADGNGDLAAIVATLNPSPDVANVLLDDFPEAVMNQKEWLKMRVYLTGM